MPKLKTHSGAKKRFNLTKTGKVKRAHAFKSHILTKKDTKRGRRIVERYGQTQKAPEKRLAEKDQKRKVYYKNYTGRVWGQAQNYDICLNSGALGVDTCADMIVQLCK